MICNKCGTQAVQYKEIGDGISEESFYDTGTAQECPKCKTKYVEYYTVFEVGTPLMPIKMASTIVSLVNKIKDKDK